MSQKISKAAQANAFDLSVIERRVKYKFRNEALIRTALTHSSYAFEVDPHHAPEWNERLEFLGDSVLSLVTSEYLYIHLKRHNEGIMTRVRSAVVCERSLHGFALKLDLGSLLLLGVGEIAANGRSRKSTLADAFEAVTGAIFLDGGLDAARAFLLPYLTGAIDQVLRTGETKDYKTLLQQVIQQSPGELLEYALTGESGPEHEKVFEVSTKLNSNVIGRGTGRTKREAEQMAAKEALALFGEKYSG